MTDYARLASTAGRLIERFGVPMSLTKPVRAEYDPTQGEFLDASETVTPCYGVRENYRNSEIDGTRVAAGDVRVYLSIVSTVEPAPGDTLTASDAGLQIVEVRPLKPGPVVVLYEIQARKP